MALYPFIFKPQLFHKLWGGHTIEQWYDHVPADYENVGEAWVISDIDKYPTEVANGSHKGDSLQDLLEVYMDELVGEKVYDVFGDHFPLLMKFIDAIDDLSIQVIREMILHWRMSIVWVKRRCGTSCRLTERRLFIWVGNSR